MNVATALSLVAATGSLIFAALWFRASFAPGWRTMRTYAAVCAAAGAYCLTDTFTSLDVSDATLHRALQLNMCMAGLFGVTWLRWFAADTGAAPSRARTIAVWAGVFIAASALVPGLMLEDRIVALRVEWLGVVYRTPQPTTFGLVAFGYFLLALGVVGVAHARRWRHDRRARVAASLTLLLVVLAINDTVVTAAGASWPLLTDTGVLVVIVGLGLVQMRRFVTDATRLEELSNRLEAEVAERSAALAEAHAALARAEKLAAVGQLAAGVAHEINNPATVVLANLTYLRENLPARLPPELDAALCLDEGLEAIERIARIVKQLLDVGRVAGGSSPRFEACAVGPIVEAAVAQVRTATRTTVAIAVTTDADARVRADPDLLLQVVLNLVTNAVHATEALGAAGRVTVRCERRGPQVEITVADNGDGVPAESQPRIFEPFFTTKPQGQGSGLGLAVSLGIMHAHGGELRLQQTSPLGTTFIATLPVVEAVATSARAAPPAAGRRASGTGRPTVLVIDDDPTVRESLRRMLGARFVVTMAGGVDEALAVVRETRGALDAVVCDVVMPDGGAARFAAELRTLAPRLSDRVVYLTGGAPHDDARAFVSAHGADVLLKPIGPAALESAVTAAMHRAAGS